MRILNVMLSEGRGGIEAAFANYAVALKAVGLDVVCCVTPDALIKPSIPQDVPIAPLAHSSQIDPRAIWRAAKILRKVKPEIIVAHGRRAYIIFAMVQRLFGKKIPMVQVLHRPRFKRLNYADHIITVSKQLRDRVIAHGIDAEKVSYIPNFLTTMPVPSIRPFHTPPVIGLLGRMVPEKGLDIFLEALAILNRRGVHFQARIGGSGPFQESLHAHAVAVGVTEQVEWLGWVHDNVPFYEAIDIFCLPSRSESFGLVVLEAFAHGKLVVSTRTSGPSELITHEHNGLLCDIGPEALADALQQALGNPELAQKLAANALAENARYTLAVVAPQIAECLLNVANDF